MKTNTFFVPFICAQILLLGACGKDTKKADEAKRSTPPGQQQTSPTPIQKVEIPAEVKSLQGSWASGCYQSQEMASDGFYRNLLVISATQYATETIYFSSLETCEAKFPALYSVIFSGGIKAGKNISITPDLLEDREIGFTVNNRSLVVHSADFISPLEQVYQVQSLQLEQLRDISVQGKTQLGVRFVPDMSPQTLVRIQKEELTLALDDCPTDSNRADISALSQNSVVYKKSQRVF